MPEPPRDTVHRIADTRARLESEVDCWVPSADAAGNAYLVPLSFHWDGSSLLLATPGASVTARNLRRAGTVRLAIGPTRDVVIVEGDVEFIPAGEIDPAAADAYAAHAGWDPRAGGGRNVYFRVRPRRIQAWREANELPGRTIMSGGSWVNGAPA